MVFDVRRLDIYRKVPKDLTQPTLTGAVVSIFCCLFIAFLFFSELYSFLATEIVSELFVDEATSTEERIAVRINITLHHLKCEYVGLDIQDDLGRHEVGMVENTDKHELPEGGCRFEGRFFINKVPGNFHVSTHSVVGQQPESIDMRHTIHAVSFGDEVKESWIPGSYNTLGGKSRTDGGGSESHDYFMKVVPTIYVNLNGNKLNSYQYTYAHRSYTSFSLGGRAIPAVWFRYDLSPITVKYVQKRQPIYSFLTTVCAIVGGTFTVAGLIDSCIFTASEVFHKQQIGKLT